MTARSQEKGTIVYRINSTILLVILHLSDSPSVGTPVAFAFDKREDCAVIDLSVIASRLGKTADRRLSTDILDELKDSLRCPRCSGEIESVGSGVGCLGIAVNFVVPPDCRAEMRSMRV
jgi:hypothetical protein